MLCLPFNTSIKFKDKKVLKKSHRKSAYIVSKLYNCPLKIPLLSSFSAPFLVNENIKVFYKTEYNQKMFLEDILAGKVDLSYGQSYFSFWWFLPKD